MRESLRFKICVDECIERLKNEKFESAAQEIEVTLEYVQSILGKMGIDYAETTYFKSLNGTVRNRVEQGVCDIAVKAITIDSLLNGASVGKCDYSIEEGLRDVHSLVVDVIQLVDYHSEETSCTK